jgi:hypothetical protein
MTEEIGGVREDAGNSSPIIDYRSPGTPSDRESLPVRLLLWAIGLALAAVTGAVVLVVIAATLGNSLRAGDLLAYLFGAFSALSSFFFWKSLARQIW